jgi:menaquinone-dependent protoporphyrinogen oxidase
MADTILILYSTVDGHTRTICRRLQDLLEQRGHRVTSASIEEAPGVDLASYGRIVIGASIRYGKHRPQVIRFINANAGLLQGRPGAFFSVNVVARKPGKNTPDTNPYMRRILKQISWRPARLAVFAGKLDYPKYGFWDRAIIRFIMLLTRGPTDRHAVVDFTDWKQVDDFAATIDSM